MSKHTVGKINFDNRNKPGDDQGVNFVRVITDDIIPTRLHTEDENTGKNLDASNIGPPREKTVIRKLCIHHNKEDKKLFEYLEKVEKYNKQYNFLKEVIEKMSYINDEGLIKNDEEIKNLQLRRLKLNSESSDLNDISQHLEDRIYAYLEIVYDFGENEASIIKNNSYFKYEYNRDSKELTCLELRF